MKEKIDILLALSRQHAGWLTIFMVAGIVLTVTSALVTPWWLGRLPKEQLERLRRGEPRHTRPTPVAISVLKNAAGVVLLLAGLAMLVLPGQGLLTIFAAGLLLSFPGKRRLLAWLLHRRWMETVIRVARRRRLRRHS